MNNIIVVSDIHSGCKFGLCPPGYISLDGGVQYKASPRQQKMMKCWNFFWDEWVPIATKNEEYAVVFNGDALDGRHHGATTQISQNLSDQKKIAELLLAPIVEKCKGNYYHIRGTEAHVGASGEMEEILAKSLGAIPDGNGRYSRWEMWMRLQGNLIHLSHHIGTTSSSAYESTGVYKEMVEAFNDAGRWGDEPPDCIVRSHRHRQFETRIATAKGYGISLVTPGWQLKTPFTYRIASARASTPQIGGYLIRHGDEDTLFTRFWVKRVERVKEVAV